MAINKVVVGDNTIVDLTEDTATEESVLEGFTFHSADGVKRTGTATSGGSVEWVGTLEDWQNDTGNIPKSSLTNDSIVNITNDYDEVTEWNDVSNKPFNTLGSDFVSNSGSLELTDSAKYIKSTSNEFAVSDGNLSHSDYVKNQLNASLSTDVYLSYNTYSKNECCIYNNRLYKSKVNNNTNNALTNTTYWESTTLKSELYNKVGFTDTSKQTTFFSDGTSGFQSGDRTISFTATENCMVCGRLDLNKPSAAATMYYEVKIDGKSITYGYMNSSISGLFRYPISYNLQKGQKIDFVISASTGTSYAVLWWYSLK